MFKKLVAIALVLVVSVSLLAGCSSTGKVYHGLGQVPTFRVGPGKDSAEVQVYSFNYTTCTALFDKNGKIIDVTFDMLEVSSPNYDGATMPHFSGWPGTEGYNVTDHASGTVSGVSDNTDETIAAEVNGWQSKRQRGDSYGMNTENDWHKQMDFYQKFFVGKTVAEINAWFAKYCSDVNGRPLKDTSTKPEDIAKLAKLTDAEKKSLSDVIAGATMSLKDAHGDLLGALAMAYENRLEVGAK
jgi:hypothetical protein